MDLQHWVLFAALGVVAAIPVVGFIIMARILKRDEAIDAAIFLAQRQLEEYLKRTK
jgi:phosphate uptake regulator